MHWRLATGISACPTRSARFVARKLKVGHSTSTVEWLHACRIDATSARSHAIRTNDGRYRKPLPTANARISSNDPATHCAPHGRALRKQVCAPRVVHITWNAQNGDHHGCLDTHWDQAKYHGAALAKLCRRFGRVSNGTIEVGLWDHTPIATTTSSRQEPERKRSAPVRTTDSTHMFGGKRQGRLAGRSAKALQRAFDQRPGGHRYACALFNRDRKWWGCSANEAFERRFDAALIFVRQLAPHTTRCRSKAFVLLFDLDGTFIDSSPGMARAANALRILQGLPPLPTGVLVPKINRGARGMLHIALDMAPEHPQ